MAISRKPVASRSRTVQPVKAGTSITSGATRKNVSVMAANMRGLTPAQRQFTQQLQRNVRRQTSITAATNTTNIMARPDFLELLPLFVQKLLVLDVFGSVAMKSRQQLIPYFKFIAEATKGETARGTVLSSPFVNRQGMDPNFTGRVVKNEIVSEGTEITAAGALVYGPILPGSVTIQAVASGVTTPYTDGKDGKLYDSTGAEAGTIDYATGAIELTQAPEAAEGNAIKATYQYDNENVGPRYDSAAGYGHEYGAQMAKGYLQLDEINLVAEAHEIACYWSIYSSFAAQTEYGANIGDMAKEASVAELTAEINTSAFNLLADTAAYKPQFNWDASPVLSGAVVPSDYLNMLKLKLGQAAASIYQATRLTRPNRLIVGSNAAEYIAMIDGFQADMSEDNVGPYHFGKLDQFEIYVAPDYDPDMWVMACKNADIRRNSALFGEYMPIMSTDQIGLANASVQQGHATMYGMKVVNPDTVVSGKLLGTF